ncbi:hypothetical protein HZC53_02785 [Candidatus Uhrbacteria bacterium]|nr:hypothetical protein [Candidatus Uhrbacteria bacterium]
MMEMPQVSPFTESPRKPDDAASLSKERYIATVNAFFAENRAKLVKIARKYLSKTGIAFDPRTDAEDVVHDALQKILDYTKSENFIPYVIETPHAFVVTVMRNIMIDRVRYGHREVPTGLGVHGDINQGGAENELLYGSVPPSPEETLMMTPDKELSAFLFEDGEFEGKKYDAGNKSQKNKDMDLLILKSYAHGETGAQTAERLMHLGYFEYDMNDERDRKKAVNLVQQRLSRVLDDVRGQLGVKRDSK